MESVKGNLHALQQKNNLLAWKILPNIYDQSCFNLFQIRVCFNFRMTRFCFQSLRGTAILINCDTHLLVFKKEKLFVAKR